MIAFAYIACTLIWGSTWMAIKFGLDGVPPFLGAALRLAIAAIVLWALVLTGRRSPRLSADGLKATAAATFLGFFANYALVGSVAAFLLYYKLLMPSVSGTTHIWSRWAWADFELLISECQMPEPALMRWARLAPDG